MNILILAAVVGFSHLAYAVKTIDRGAIVDPQFRKFALGSLPDHGANALAIPAKNAVFLVWLQQGRVLVKVLRDSEYQKLDPPVEAVSLSQIEQLGSYPIAIGPGPTNIIEVGYRGHAPQGEAFFVVRSSGDLRDRISYFNLSATKHPELPLLFKGSMGMKRLRNYVLGSFGACAAVGVCAQLLLKVFGVDISYLAALAGGTLTGVAASAATIFSFWYYAREHGYLMPNVTAFKEEQRDVIEHDGQPVPPAWTQSCFVQIAQPLQEHQQAAE